MAFRRLGVRSLCVLCLLGVTVSAQARLEFDAAVLKRNTSGEVPLGSTPDPATGEFRLRRVPLSTLILRSFPPQTGRVEFVNLPSWAGTGGEFYDFVARSAPRRTPEEQQQMYRAFLAERMKLAAHMEPREQQGYNLVFARADHKLGPGMKPTALDCATATGRPQPGIDIMAFATTHCGISMTDLDGTMRSGGLDMEGIVRRLSTATGRPVFDKTGLTGFYDITFKFNPFPAQSAAPPSPDDLPTVFTAAPEQLGLKLESGTVTWPVVVIDHIERPTEN